MSPRSNTTSHRTSAAALGLGPVPEVPLALIVMGDLSFTITARLKPVQAKFHPVELTLGQENA